MTSPGSGAPRAAALVATSFARVVGRVVPALPGPSFGEEASAADRPRSSRALAPLALALRWSALSAAGAGCSVRVGAHALRRSRGFGTTSQRQALRGASTPANLVKGYRGGHVIAARRARNSTPVITRYLPRCPRATYLSRYATRPPGSRRSRSSDSGGRAAYRRSRSRPRSSPPSMWTPACRFTPASARRLPVQLGQMLRLPQEKVRHGGPARGRAAQARAQAAAPASAPCACTLRRQLAYGIRRHRELRGRSGRVAAHRALRCRGLRRPPRAGRADDG